MLTTRAAMPSFVERLVSLDAERNLAAGADQDHRRLAAFGIGQDIGAARDARRRRRSACGRGSAAAGGSAPGRRADASARMMTRHASATSLASAGRSVMQAGNAAQRDELLDRLVRRAVLADADANHA